MKHHKILFLKVATAAAIILFTASSPAAPAATAVPADQPVSYTVEPTRKVIVACNIDFMKSPDGLTVGEIVYNPLYSL